jgi:hypothetical protein
LHTHQNKLMISAEIYKKIILNIQQNGIERQSLERITPSDNRIRFHQLTIFVIRSARLPESNSETGRQHDHDRQRQQKLMNVNNALSLLGFTAQKLLEKRVEKKKTFENSVVSFPFFHSCSLACLFVSQSS